MDQEFDLWGEPIPPRTERRGRPEHKVTDEKRRLVKVLRATNHAAPEIALAMGISERTLRKHYLPELRIGGQQLRFELLYRVQLEVEKGSVPAMKLLHHLLEKADLAGAPRIRSERPAKIGKKAQALLDAVNGEPESSMGELMARRRDGLGQVH